MAPCLAHVQCFLCVTACVKGVREAIVRDQGRHVYGAHPKQDRVCLLPRRQPSLCRFHRPHGSVTAPYGIKALTNPSFPPPSQQDPSRLAIAKLAHGRHATAPPFHRPPSIQRPIDSPHPRTRPRSTHPLTSSFPLHPVLPTPSPGRLLLSPPDRVRLLRAWEGPGWLSYFDCGHKSEMGGSTRRHHLQAPRTCSAALLSPPFSSPHCLRPYRHQAATIPFLTPLFYHDTCLPARATQTWRENK